MLWSQWAKVLSFVCSIVFSDHLFFKQMRIHSLRLTPSISTILELVKREGQQLVRSVYRLFKLKLSVNCQATLFKVTLFSPIFPASTNYLFNSESLREAVGEVKGAVDSLPELLMMLLGWWESEKILGFAETTRRSSLIASGWIWLVVRLAWAETEQMLQTPLTGGRNAEEEFFGPAPAICFQLCCLDRAWEMQRAIMNWAVAGLPIARHRNKSAALESTFVSFFFYGVFYGVSFTEAEGF